MFVSLYGSKRFLWKDLHREEVRNVSCFSVDMMPKLRERALSSAKLRNTLLEVELQQMDGHGKKRQLKGILADLIVDPYDQSHDLTSLKWMRSLLIKKEVGGWQNS